MSIPINLGLGGVVAVSKFIPNFCSVLGVHTCAVAASLRSLIITLGRKHTYLLIHLASPN